jgi:uncharacterized protein (TIGR03084 family)|tara:strand:- start:5921 stop:6709 length:789 start_codon:yes stop_codon:yes gene_type:complete
MFQQAVDLREEGEDLYAFLVNLDESRWSRKTPFNGWSVNQVVQHLHGADRAAVRSLQDPDGFRQSLGDEARASSVSAPADEPPPERAELLDVWWSYFCDMCELLGNADPSLRVPWFGPDMGVRMFTTARQMETWSHAQDIYDLYEFKRSNTDRLKNVAVIGVRTFGWTFVNRQMNVPTDIPFVRLSSPSGALWEWNDPSDSNFVEGAAVDFCHVVTQGRNIGDVDLNVVGDTATLWMSIAQCFAGPPKDPPAIGARFCPGYP